jgi:murein L,D-transpeptidase YcbB/YkuD
VRVQDWEKLTYYILRNDSVSAAGTRSYTPTDSLRNWLREKQKKSIAVRNKIPLYIRYFTCEGENGNIRFYDDVYSEDKLLREKYFSSK